MKNVLSNHEVEVRSAEFLKAMEDRVVKLENEMKTKVDESQVKVIVQEVIKNTESNETSVNVANVVETVNQTVSDFRDSALRKKNISINGVPEAQADEGTVRKLADTEFVSSFLNT